MTDTVLAKVVDDVEGLTLFMPLEVDYHFSGYTINCLCLRCLFSASISTAEGSALVKLGNTSVVCGIKPVIQYSLNHCGFFVL